MVQCIASSSDKYQLKHILILATNNLLLHVALFCNLLIV